MPTITLKALFDGEVFIPEQPVNLQPGTRGRITYETHEPIDADPVSSRNLNEPVQIEEP